MVEKQTLAQHCNVYETSRKYKITLHFVERRSIGHRAQQYRKERYVMSI